MGVQCDQCACASVDAAVISIIILTAFPSRLQSKKEIHKVIFTTDRLRPVLQLTRGHWCTFSATCWNNERRKNADWGVKYTTYMWMSKLSFYSVPRDVFTMNHSPQTSHALFKAEPFPPFLVRRPQLQWLIALSDSKLKSVTLALGLGKSLIGLFWVQMTDCGVWGRNSIFSLSFFLNNWYQLELLLSYS